MTIHILDARRLLCPMPVIKLQNLVKTCQPGDVIEISCTDPGTQQDIPMWCKIFKHEVSVVSENNTEWLFTIIVN